jgi:hypothetical protein
MTWSILAREAQGRFGVASGRPMAERLIELQRLHDKSLERFQPFVTCLAGRNDPVGLIDRDAIEARVAAFHAASALTDAGKSTR